MSTLFYRNPVLLNAGQHAASGLREIRDFSFAREANAIPVNLVEFPLVARHYPIAFVGGDNPYPAAIVGLKEGNLFIDGEGAWKPGCYVPAYVRRYPFIFADDKDRGLLSLCVTRRCWWATAAAFVRGQQADGGDRPGAGVLQVLPRRSPADRSLRQGRGRRGPAERPPGHRPAERRRLVRADRLQAWTPRSWPS